MPGTWSRPCVQTVDRDVAVPNFDAVLNKWLLKILRGQICLKKISLLTPTPPPRLPEPSTSAKRKSFGP